MKKILVIGYGNELRRDDGLGPKLACAIEQLKWPNVTVLVCHQLTPELADPIRRADEVVFIDASLEGIPEVQVRRLDPETAGQLRAHTNHPSTVLALARALYGAQPRAWWLTLPAVETGFGERLSASAQRSLVSGLAAFKQLCDRIATCRNPHPESTRRAAPVPVELSA